MTGRIFFEIAKRNIRIHMLRSSLAMLGIIIGVVAIASMDILGNSMVLAVSDSLRTVGDSVIVTPHVGGTARGFGGGMGGGSSTLTITEQNFEQIKRVSAPNVAIPVLQTSDRMKLGVGTDDIVAPIYGLNPDDVPDLLKLKDGGTAGETPGVLSARNLLKTTISRSAPGLLLAPMGPRGHSGSPVSLRSGGWRLM